MLAVTQQIEPVKLEECVWRLPPMLNDRKCLNDSCEALIDPDACVLFFPRRRRAMCGECAREYLAAAE